MEHGKMETSNAFRLPAVATYKASPGYEALCGLKLQTILAAELIPKDSLQPAVRHQISQTLLAALSTRP